MSILALAAALALSSPSVPAAVQTGSPCLGAPAAAGETVVGTVLHVIDGQRLCLASGPTPASWTELRVNTVYMHQAGDDGETVSKASLMSVAFGKRMVCRITAAPGGEKVADCRIKGEQLAALMTAPGAELAAAAWAETSRQAHPPTLRMAAR